MFEIGVWKKMELDSYSGMQENIIGDEVPQKL